MARHRRYFLKDVPVHVIQRGTNRRACFFSDQNYALYLEKLREYSLKYDVAIHSFVLMTNHIHLLLTPRTETGVSYLMQSLGRHYVQAINSIYKRSGTLWDGRFKASLVCSEQYFLTVSRYIELNPVRAGMVNHVSDYQWSSYRINALGKANDLLEFHKIYRALGKDKDECCLNYRSLFDGRNTNLLDNQIRNASNKGWVLGDNDFKSNVEEQLGFALPPFVRGGDRKSKIFKSVK